MVIGTPYDPLIIAFVWGVWASASGRRSLRIASSLLFAYGLLGVAWPFASLHQHEVLAAGGGTLADTQMQSASRHRPDRVAQQPKSRLG
jgi:hypothetical protein